MFDRRKDLPSSYSMQAMAQDTAEAMRLLGLEQICLFGVSRGGMIAMDIAIRHPELVEKLVLGSTSACVGTPSHTSDGSLTDDLAQMLDNLNIFQ